MSKLSLLARNIEGQLQNKTLHIYIEIQCHLMGEYHFNNLKYMSDGGQVYC